MITLLMAILIIAIVLAVAGLIKSAVQWVTIAVILIAVCVMALGGGIIK